MTNPTPYFQVSAQDRLIERLHEALESAERVPLITGPQGAGKTTLAFRFLASSPEHWLPCRIDANPLMHPDQLLVVIANCLDLSPGEPDLERRIPERLTQLRLEGRLPVLLVDDADQLPIPTLMALLRLHQREADGLPLCALVLLADPAIVPKFQSEQLAAMGTAQILPLELPPLSDTEIRDYVLHFLETEEIASRVPLRPEHLRRIHQLSQGIPGQIDEAVVEILRETRREAPRRPIPRHYLIAAAGGLGLLVLAAGLILWPTGDDAPSSQEAPLAPQAGQEITLALPEEPVTEAAPPPTAAAPITTTELPRPPTVPEPPTPASPVEQTVPIQRGREEDSEPLIPPPAKPAAPQRPAARLPKPAVKAASTWILEQPPAHYGLQLLALADEAQVKAFMTRHRLEGKAGYYKARRKGKDLYILVYGSFPDRATALAARDRLPAALQKARPWPRPFKAIRGEISQSSP